MGASPRRRSRRVLAPAVAWTFLGTGLALAIAQGVAPTPVIETAAPLLVAVGTITALVVGPLRNRPVHVRPWRYLLIAAVAWSIASAIRSTLGVNDGQVPLADAISLVGYLFAFLFAFRALRVAGVRGAGLTLDTILVALGVLLIGWMVITAPSLQMDRTPYQRAADIVFPALDAALLCGALRIVLTNRRRTASAWLIAAAVAFVLAADLGWALTAGRVVEVPVAAQIVLYVMGMACLGAAALHPSMRELTQIRGTEVRPLGPLRIAAMGVALVLPTLAALVHPPRTALEWVTLAAIAVAVAAIVFLRALGAVQQGSRFEATLRYQATHDLLTGLPNRDWLEARIAERLADAATSGTTVEVALIDIDGFRHVNDTWGHATGDELLKDVAARVRGALGREYDVARTGGDEFAIVASGCDVAELVRTVVEDTRKPWARDGISLVVTASIGVSSCDGRAAAKAAQDLLREADTALYRAKDEGGDGAVVFEESMRARSVRRMEVETDLRRALDNEELRVFYQPVVAARDGSWQGVEALVRWEHPTRGLVPPFEFIGVAEDTGLIVPLGAWVLRRTCRQIADWRNRLGVGWSASVNLSARQLRNAAIVETVESAVADSGIDPQSLWIELTESVMVGQDASALEVLERIHATGCHLAVDDFGTGYSSLSYLNRFPIDRVKIDRSFITGLGTDSGSTAIVRAIIGMASALDIDTVAEGIETEQQREHLMMLGCELGQGYLFAKPMPADELEAGYLEQTRRAGPWVRHGAEA